MTSFSIDQFSTAPSCCYAEENSQTPAFRQQNTQNVAWMKRQFSACQTPRSMFPSYTMLKSMRKSKNRYFYLIFVSPGDAPGAITLCCMDGKRIRCLQIVSLNVPTAHLTITVFQIEWDIGQKSSFFSYPLAFDAPVRGVPVGILPSRLVWNN